MRRADPRSVLVVVQNLPLPGDRRVWLECQALRDAGYRVAAVTPMAPGDPPYAEVDGIHLYKYPPAPATDGVASFVVEFAYAWLRTLRLAWRVWRERGFGVLQACNPPDTYWLLALIFRPFGVRFVFDQHDLCPEVYDSRFARPSPLLRQGLLLLERATYRCADRVIATNESYRRTALTRGRVAPARVTVVRTGPDSRRMRPGPQRPELRRGREHLAVYIGVMGPQDGVDVLVRAVADYVHRLGRRDCHFAILGAGDCWDDLVALVAELGIDDVVTMPGRVSDEDLFAHLSTASVGLSPDPPSPLNDVSTMNKTMEYLAFALPVVAFDLAETRVSAGESACYVAGSDPAAYAEAVAALLDDPDRREVMGRAGRERVEAVLDWRHQAPAYVGVFDGLRAEAPGRPA